jgi:large subunit ribosomal protein L32
MAVPKRRHSSTRGKKLRTHWKLHKPSRSLCSHCSQPKLPHRVCRSCGYYDGEEVIAQESARSA